jgi:RNA polymerase sigma factor (sigma-70 family)
MKEWDIVPGNQAAKTNDTDRHAGAAALLEAAQQGDRTALDQLVRVFSPMLWQVARAQGLDRDSASDVVQTAWLELLGSLQRIRSPGALAAWLITVTKRESWRVRKARRSERPNDAELARLSDADPIPEERFLEKDQRRRLWAAVEQLPEQCRSLLRVIAFIHRPDYVVLGQELGMPVGSIGPTRGRCLAKLRRLLISDPSGGWR